MASFLLDLVKPCVEKLIDGAIAEARHVFCFTCIVKEFEEGRAGLEPERETIEQRVKVAKERDKDIQANVVSWLDDVDKLNQVDLKTNQTCFFGFCPDCIWRYKKGKELANYLEKIKPLIEKGEKLGNENIELSHCLPGVERYSLKDYISFESRKAKYNELLDALKDDNNYATGLLGMGGIGKTTLARKVGNELKQSKQFAHVVDTTVSSTPNIKKIQDEIAGSLGLGQEWERCNESDRPKKLWSRLTNGEKILVILDDVWDRGPPLDFDAIGIPKQDNHKGCRILVTSRSIKTFNIMDCDKRIELDVLSKEDAWNMFKSYARISTTTSKKLIDKGRKIAKECKQLPIAISVIASSLKGQQNREHEYDVTLKSLKQPVSMHGVDDDVVGIYNCLKISYDNLMDEKAKGLFLLCSVFREDEQYSVEVLTRLSIGVGLFGDDDDKYNDAREKVVVAKNKLVDSCLLLEDYVKSLKMHDLVRVAAQWIANKEKCMDLVCIKLFDKKQKSLVEKQTNIKYLLCEGKCMDLFSFNFDGSKLEILIVKVDKDDDCEHIELPNSFFQNVIHLRVLYFSGKDSQPLPFSHNHFHRSLSLPPTIQLLTNIRSMLVDSVDLGDISILGNLQSLETLDLFMCKINELPNQITKLNKFKLLKLRHCEIRMNNPFEVIKRCSSLEELYFKHSFNDFCQEITLPELQRYYIGNGFRVRNKLLMLFSFLSEGACEFSKYVAFCGDEECHNYSASLTAEKLYLGGISQLQCLVDTIGSQVPNVLSNLVVLQLKEMEDLEELSNGPLSFESLNNLEMLSIKDCEQLQSLFKGKPNLCNLKAITLENCPMLVSLFEVSTSRSLVLLETLIIVNCEGLETIIADERREDEEIDDSGNNKSHGSVFSKLKVIDVKRCHLLEYVLPFISAQGLPVLETIRITKCDGLKYVFGQSQHVELVSLSELELIELPKFIGIFEECYDPMSSCVNGSSSTSKAEIELDPIKCNTFSWWTRICCLTKIPLVDDVDGDQPHNCSVASESNSYGLDIWERAQCLGIQSKILCNIKKIVLTHFPKMKSVFILSIAPIMQLETLTIKNCDELKHVIIDTGDHNIGDNICVNVFPKLKYLHVEDCAQLEYIIFGPETDDHQNHMEELSGFAIIDGQQLDLGLQQIELYDLPMMTCLFVGPKYSFALNNLTSIKFKQCDKLKIAFSTSILRFLPQLLYLRIEECNELEHIIEDDLENIKNSNSLSSTTFFPKLEVLVVINCNKLKYVLPFSVCKELPKLNVMLITEANELEEIFKSQDDQKVDIPNLKIVGGVCFRDYKLIPGNLRWE